MTSARFGILALFLVLSTGACGPDKDGGDSSGSSSVGATDPNTDGVSSSPTGGSGAGTTDAPTTTGAPTSTAPTTTSTTDPTTSTTDPTTSMTDPTEPPPDLAGACSLLCARRVECADEVDFDACFVNCGSSFEGSDVTCVAAFDTQAQCLAALTCEELSLADQAGLCGPCGATASALQDACDSAPGCGSGGGGVPGNCEWSSFCTGEPTRRMMCDLDTCVCLLGCEEVGQCDAGGVCAGEGAIDPALLEAKFGPCCGF